MDPTLLRNYFATIYELPSGAGTGAGMAGAGASALGTAGVAAVGGGASASGGATLRVSLDGDVVQDPSQLPELLTKPFAILTAYNPRSMLLPRKVNEGRHLVMRDMLILGCYRVEACVGYDDEPDGMWREPAWLVHGMDREEAMAFGRVFRQNAVVYCREARPEIIVTDPTCEDLGRTFVGHWRIRA
jgi:hypothetical protein